MCVAYASDYNYIMTHAGREGDHAFLILVSVFSKGWGFPRGFRASVRFRSAKGGGLILLCAPWSGSPEVKLAMCLQVSLRLLNNAAYFLHSKVY